jgi:predicted NUDIX family NTP pyrophosphohydrolase
MTAPAPRLLFEAALTPPSRPWWMEEDDPGWRIKTGEFPTVEDKALRKEEQ